MQATTILPATPICQSSDERTLSIVVTPSPANAWWAWLIYLALSALLAAYLYRNARRVVAAKRAARKAEMEKEQEQRTNQMNMSFFANIAHEFRTPLTMIAGPVGQLATSEHLNTEDKGLLKVAQRSIQRMFRLVNQLMDFNKLENDTLRLYVEPVDVVSTLNNICDTFEFNAREKGLTLNRFGMDDKVESWTDSDKLEKIMSNLLSNALKFTPTGGHIDVALLPARQPDQGRRELGHGHRPLLCPQTGRAAPRLTDRQQPGTSHGCRLHTGPPHG